MTYGIAHETQRVLTSVQVFNYDFFYALAPIHFRELYSIVSQPEIIHMQLIIYEGILGKKKKVCFQ